MESKYQKITVHNFILLQWLVAEGIQRCSLKLLFWQTRLSSQDSPPLQAIQFRCVKSRYINNHFEILYLFRLRIEFMESLKVIMKSYKRIIQKWSIAFRILPFVILTTILKFLSHKFGLEIMELNALFTSLVAGTIFLIGFLISGVLSDYKESEKMPSELVASMRTLFDDTITIYKGKNSDTADQFLKFQKSFIKSLMNWFYKKERTKSILNKISMMNDYFVEFDKEGIQANYIIKMKNEQNSLRKLILRIDTIRDTEFVGSAYAIVEAMGFLTAFGLIIIKIEPFYASLFLTLLITFLISYMFFLIKDLDNPFDYSIKGESGIEVSLKPIHDLESEFEDYK